MSRVAFEDNRRNKKIKLEQADYQAVFEMMARDADDDGNKIMYCVNKQTLVIFLIYTL
jgi:hypothetical protein